MLTPTSRERFPAPRCSRETARVPSHPGALWATGLPADVPAENVVALRDPALVYAAYELGTVPGEGR